MQWTPVLLSEALLFVCLERPSGTLPPERLSFAAAFLNIFTRPNYLHLEHRFLAESFTRLSTHSLHPSSGDGVKSDHEVVLGRS